MSLYKDASLVMIPSAYKDGKLYSIRPTDGSGDFTFSRGSNLAATRVDVNGLIEKGRENLLLQSNQFDNGTYWNQFATPTGGEQGYDGSNDAFLLSKNATSYKSIQQLVTGSGVLTLSAYFKAGTLNEATLYLNVTSGGSNPYVKFNLTTGAAVESSNEIESNSVDVGNGWWKLSMTINGTIADARIYAGWSDAVAGNIYIQDAQLEQGLVATDYIETGTSAAQSGILEDMPRLDYSGGASCPSLLLEPQRTNIITNSEYFESWNNNDILFDFGYAAPDGTNSAYKITKNGTQAYLYLTGISAENDSRSIYARTTSGTGQVNLTSHNSNSNSLFTITEEWQRFEITSTPLIATNYYAVDFRGGNLDEVILWGAQLETGSYPTSYIPTYGTSQTRSGDAPADRNDLQDYIGTNEGTWFMDFDELFFDITGTGVGSIQISNAGVSSQSIEFVQRGNTQYKITLNNSTSVDYQGGADKVAIAWHSEGIKIFINGTQQYASTSGQYSSAFTRLVMSYSSRRPHIKMKQLAFFPTALTDSECIALTTL